jgi:hypothetical protein
MQYIILGVGHYVAIYPSLIEKCPNLKNFDFIAIIPEGNMP